MFGPTIEGHGCPGLGNVAAGLIMRELERGDSGLRTFASVQGSLAMMAIHLFGSEEQKERWLPAMALECARTARDILGGEGILDSRACMRHMCNLESVKTYEGTEDMHRLILGQEITGLSAFGG